MISFLRSRIGKLRERAVRAHFRVVDAGGLRGAFFLGGERRSENAREQREGTSRSQGLESNRESGHSFPPVVPQNDGKAMSRVFRAEGKAYNDLRFVAGRGREELIADKGSPPVAKALGWPRDD